VNTSPRSQQTALDLDIDWSFSPEGSGQRTGMRSAAGHCRLVAAVAALAWAIRDNRIRTVNLELRVRESLARVARFHPDVYENDPLNYVATTLNEVLDAHSRPRLSNLMFNDIAQTAA
jgi:hypothetical protein